MYAIGAQLNRRAVFTKTEMKRGLIPGEGHVVSSSDQYGSKEFVSVKLAGGVTYLNGQAVTIDTATGVAVVGTTNPALGIAGRVGILAFASATATSTAVGTCFAWAQIYGRANALTSASITAAGQMMSFGVDGRLIAVVAGASASAMIGGISSIGTATAALAVMLPVMLSYPRLHSWPA
jgi:hypothetical protein